MSRPDPVAPSPLPATFAAGAATAAPAPKFSLERLSSAFARLMGARSIGSPGGAAAPQVAVEADDPVADDGALPVTPRMIVEGLLFVGDAEGRPLSNRQLAAHIRDVTPDEVDDIVRQLNAGYQRDGAAYEIAEHSGGYRLQLRNELSRVRDRFRGRVRAARLTPQALEVLAIVAYRQGVTVDELNRLRSVQSYAILCQLVRRQLVRVERSGPPARVARYFTTPRFNQLFGVASPEELPRGEEIVDG